MKIYTSYFYKIRFFTPNMIPISTAAWDPKWFHQNKGHSYQYLDKNGVINGIRAEDFILPGEYWEDMVKQGKECSKTCGQSAPNCMFMTKYEEYLNTLNFNNILNRCNKIAEQVKEQLKFNEEPVLVFIVHEPASCNCAERPVIQNWFKKNGIEVNEWIN